MPKRISAADKTPIHVVIVTLDSHLASAADRACHTLRREIPGLKLSLHAAAEWGTEPETLAQCRSDIATADIIVVTQLFMEEHIEPVLPALEARRAECDAMVGCMSAAPVVRLTRLGQFAMDNKQSGPMALLKRLRGKKKDNAVAGSRQMAMLRRLPKILRFIPGTAQDVRAYFVTLQYWLAGSEDNIASMVGFLVSRYAAGQRSGLRGCYEPRSPLHYPEVGVYHPQMNPPISENVAALPGARKRNVGTVGVVVMRSYLLAGNTNHYDGVIAALEARGLRVITAFASGLDARPAVEGMFVKNGQSQIDALVSLTGFPLIGGPAYNDAQATEKMLADLDVPFIAAEPVEFQTLEEWERSEQGLLPLEATMMVALPELEGATGSMVFGGRSQRSENGHDRDMQCHPERAACLADRVAKVVALRRKAKANRKIAIVLFNFPPNGGSVGTAANLAVFESLFNTLGGLARDGYQVQVPASVDELRQSILGGNASHYGTDANVYARVTVDDYVRNEPWLAEIESQWGPAPGRQLSDGAGLMVLGAQFGNVFVGVQPGFGYEGDPMRLLFERGFAPTHAFSAFYRYLREDFAADAVLHFGTHGALEFMPGKQAGLSSECWPDRLIGSLPNYYLYAANNPSEGTLAKRRAGATLISYLTPPVTQAGLYRGLLDLKASVSRWRALPPDSSQEERIDLAELIQVQACGVDLADAEPVWEHDAAEQRITGLVDAIRELEYTLIPNGMHVVGAATSAEEREGFLMALAQAEGKSLEAADLQAILADDTAGADRVAELEALDGSFLSRLRRVNRLLSEDHEIPGILRALNGQFIAPAPGGDLLRGTEMLPTGRNLHGFDPFRMPSQFAVQDGFKQAQRLLARHCADGEGYPESLALVLWGTDNLKTEGGPIAQALALLGARPRFDPYGKLTGAQLIPLQELGRPRIDVLLTLSGIFRDLLPLQTRLLAEACFLAASADEPLDQNFVRKHTLNYQAQHDCDLETAALRVFSNANGAYGSNVNQLIDDGRWREEDELADAYAKRKCFAFGRDGVPAKQAELLQSALADVQLAYQNLDSVETGVTTVDHYFDTLGGINRAVRRASGKMVPVYIGDQTAGAGKVRTLDEQVVLETRTRMLNPKWYESMLEHGYEGVRTIESHVTNTLGWSATTGQVSPWVYQRITETYILDPKMRARLAKLNPTASAKMTDRLIEAHERSYWSPDAATLDALRDASEEMEDRLEGIMGEAAA